MVARRKRASAVKSSSPLDNDCILRKVLEFVGYGHFVFVGAVCRGWLLRYAELDDLPEDASAAEEAAGSARKHVHTLACTTCKSVFTSPTLVRHADHDWLRLHSPVWQAAAGKYADTATLEAALSVGLPLSTAMLHGIALSANKPKVAWARKQLGGRHRLPVDIMHSAAAGGSVEMLRSLVRAGHMVDSNTSRMAAAHNHIPALVYLRSRGCPVEPMCGNAAAGGGHLAVLQWLQEQACVIQINQN
jgi:hypothetical protein